MIGDAPWLSCSAVACNFHYSLAGQGGVGMILQKAGREVVVKKLAAGWAPK